MVIGQVSARITALAFDRFFSCHFSFLSAKDSNTEYSSEVRASTGGEKVSQTLRIVGRAVGTKQA